MSIKIPIISIIIPVYNVKEYLQRCVDSVLNHTIKDIEIILVDDGSTDICPTMCDKYAAKDGRVKVIHKSNGGVSSARNAGLEAAKGRYIAFVDSDDFVEPEYLETLYHAIVKYSVDIAAVGIKDSSGKETIYQDILKKGEERVVDNHFEFDWMKTLCSSVCKLYTKDIISDLRFDETLVYAEDTLFSVQVMCKKEGTRIVLIAKPLYLYDTIRENSATHQPFNEKRLSSIIAFEKMLVISRNTGLYKSVALHRENSLMNLYCQIRSLSRTSDYKKELSYLRQEIIKARRQGIKPKNIKENLIEWMHLYAYPVLRLYVIIKGKLN